MRRNTPYRHLKSSLESIQSPVFDQCQKLSACLVEPSRRGGAVIIVVLALLSLMIFLGVFFFEFAQEEQIAAQNFASNINDPMASPDYYFDEADKQLIIGPDSNRSMSALYAGDSFSTPPPTGLSYGQPGTPHSLLAHVIGRIRPSGSGSPVSKGMQPSDVLPHNGHGISVQYIDNDGDGFYGPNDYALFDMNGDGTPDATLPPEDADNDGVLDPGEDIIVNGQLDPSFAINYSRLAQKDASLDAFAQPDPAYVLPPFQPDVDYTYPDINNSFLAYDRIDQDTNARILAPSFLRLDLFPSKRSTGFQDLYTDPATKRLLLRPHREHRYADNIRRFLVATNGTKAESGDTSRVIMPFPGLETASPPVNPVDSNSNGVYNEMGIYSDPTGATSYDLDVDLTGDGTPDGIWIDLGQDIVDLSDGRQFVPLFSFYILDADSLINLNAHGKLREGYYDGSVTYTSGLFSTSNTGASASEVNPLRAFTGNPGDFSGSDLTFVQQEHAYNFGFSSSAAQTKQAMANMELAFLLGGRLQSPNGTPVTGRYGDQSYVGAVPPAVSGTNPFPRPGFTNQTSATLDDDDKDDRPDDPRYQGGARRDTSLYDPRLGGNASVVVPHASHPVDPHGSGSGAFTATGRSVVAGVTGSPVVWPHYQEGWEAPLSTSSGTIMPIESPYPYGPPDPLPLDNSLYSNGTTTMIDEEDETRLANPNRRADDIYLPDENFALQVSELDFQQAGVTSRLKNVAPFNFNYSQGASDIRKRFTTSSWDLSELTYTPWRYVSGARTETSAWTGAIAVSTGSPTGSTHLFFPPEFGTTPGATIFQANDPIRPEVRALLTVEDTDTVNQPGYGRRESLNLPLLSGGTANGSAQLWRQPLNLNKLLVGFDGSGYPIFRDLMPHPDIYNTFKTTSVTTITIDDIIHDHTASVPSSAQLSLLTSGTTEQIVTAQEWWARYDRQRMARDIFTLLYLVGAQSNIDPTKTAYPNPEMVREMAQFAVNYVDALDRDDVITKFEYDNNLSDGWTWSTGGPVVYGVERASLSFSEVQFLQIAPQADLDTTLHKEETNDVHQYLYVELRNSSFLPVELAEGWRISRVEKGTGSRDASVEFKTKNYLTASHDAKSVSPGKNFLIATHDGYVKNGNGNPIWSDIYVDHTGSTELESVLPSSDRVVTDNTVIPDPQADLDLTVSGLGGLYDHESYVAHRNGDGTTYDTNPLNTKLVRMIPSVAAVATEPVFELVLERRQNLNGIVTGTFPTEDASSMGDWIEVDRIQVDPDQMSSPGKAEFKPASTNTQASNLVALQAVHSVERRQPFDPVQITNTNTGATNHTMVKLPGSLPQETSFAGNFPSPATFTLWQPHFDRDFTSAYELLSVPLYGNWPLSELVAGTHTGVSPNTFFKEIHGGTQFNLAPGASGSSSGRLSGDFTAGMRFNFPNGKPGRPYQGWNTYNYQNAWYRLFDFVSVHRRADQQSEELISGFPGSIKPVFRVPGKINLNTLRDETVLAALLDDETHLAYGNPHATIDSLTANRNWYLELSQSRDGTDYFANLAGVPQLAIPNSMDSRPFRSASKPDPYATATLDDAVENGLLRSTPRRNGTTLAPRPEGTAYSTPSLAPPANFTSTGLWSGPPPYDTASLTWQGLFDAGDLTTSDGLDHHTRNRILAKIANNSTTKSHVFFVWTAVGYFEAHRELNHNRVQIGARINDFPIRRRFSVVDMSKIDEAYDSNSNTFDEKAFIIFQKRLR